MRHREVDVVTIASTGTFLLFKTGDNRVEIGRVGMNGDVKNIVPIVKDLLNALPMMHVSIQNDDPSGCSGNHFCRNCCIVQIAESTCRVPPCVMARGPAKSVGSRVSIQHGLCGVNGALRGPVTSRPCMLTNRTTAVGQVHGCKCQYASLGVRMSHVDVGDHLVTPVWPEFLPLRVCCSQKYQIGRIVH